MARPTLILFILVIGAGALLGALAFVVAGTGQGWPTTVVKTASGWRLSSPDGLAQSGLALDDRYLVWSNGQCLELLDARSCHTAVLQPPPENGTDGSCGLISDRYVAWLVYRVKDLATGRAWRLTLADPEDLVDCRLAGHCVVWATVVHVPGTTAVSMRIGALDLRSGKQRVVAQGLKVSGLAVSGDRILWTDRSRTGRGPLFMQGTDGGPIVSLKIAGDHFSTLPVTSGDVVAWTHNKEGSGLSEVVVMRLDK